MTLSNASVTPLSRSEKTMSRPSHGERLETRDKRLEKDVPSPTDSGAAAPFRGCDVVAEYVNARSEAGLATDVRSRAVLGKYAKQLILAGGWDRDILLLAARQFAASKRHPRFFHEWVATIFNASSEREHLEHKVNDHLPADVLAAIGNPLRRK